MLAAITAVANTIGSKHLLQANVSVSNRLSEPQASILQCQKGVEAARLLRTADEMIDASFVRCKLPEIVPWT